VYGFASVLAQAAQQYKLLSQQQRMGHESRASSERTSRQQALCDETLSIREAAGLAA